MIRLAGAATVRIEALWDYDRHLSRFEAAERLARAMREATALIAQNPRRGRPDPASYRALAAHGFLWLKVHRYWIAYAIRADGIVITNLHDDASDIPARIAAPE